MLLIVIPAQAGIQRAFSALRTQCAGAVGQNENANARLGLFLYSRWLTLDKGPVKEVAEVRLRNSANGGRGCLVQE
ncbi:hypothetical protein [Coxiella burnetii]|uniref:hypothetical protein n=1 Tax=Coxiella burnetii TaxID=777 RepID=UPI0022303085|nr:hypothetical protein [Coxiella burnetii]